MAPEPTRRKPRENAFPYEVGVKGRKTGITLPDTGIRDENGLEPIDHLFSSPQKGTASRSSTKMNDADATLYSDEMDEGESTVPEPTAVIASRGAASIRMPPPKSKSPIKTYLNSPARRNPSIGPVSSLVRASEIEPIIDSPSTNVRRRLDFSSGSLDANEDSPPTTMSPQKKGGGVTNPKLGNGKLTSNTQLAPPKRAFQFNGGGDEDETSELAQSDMGAEDSIQMINGGDDEDIAESIIEEQVEEPKAQPVQPTKKRGRPPKNTVTTTEEPAVKDVGEGIENAVKKNKGRPKKVHTSVEEEEGPEKMDGPPTKRARRSLDVPAVAKITANNKSKKTTEEAASKDAVLVKRSKKDAAEAVPETATLLSKARKLMKEPAQEDAVVTSKTKKAASEGADISSAVTGQSKKTATIEVSEASKHKRSGASLPPNPKNPIKKTKLATIAESDSPKVQRGPPMPRRPGLMTVRRETPMEGVGFKQTRSGRNSIRPLAYWKNERAEYDEDEVADLIGKFLVPTIKGVVRVDEPEDSRKQAKRSKSGRPKKRVEESEEDYGAEPWEEEPGMMYGNVVVWDPEDPLGETSEETHDRLALSSAAIDDRAQPSAGFNFCKALTLPFFGCGFVDLLPGAMKKTKPSRKMQMAFFVFTGRVKAIINGTEFRISKGGMFQVPRGNQYSIENDHDVPARIFFSQGCELEEELPPQSP